MHKGNPKYKKEFCKGLIDHMAKGFTFETYCVKIGCSIQSMYEWIEKHEEWKIAKELGTMKALLLHEERLNAKMDGKAPKGSELTAIIFALKTRFHKYYGDKQEQSHTGQIQINIDQQDKDL